MKSFLRRHKKLAIGLGLVAVVVGSFNVWSLTASIRGHYAARFDLWRGHYVILRYGMPPPWSPEYDRLLHERYGIEFHTVALCIVPPDLKAHADSYDRVMAAAAKRKFGHDIFTECYHEAEARFQTQRAANAAKE